MKKKSYSLFVLRFRQGLVHLAHKGLAEHAVDGPRVCCYKWRTVLMSYLEFPSVKMSKKTKNVEKRLKMSKKTKNVEKD
jgi:hypothetical protein